MAKIQELRKYKKKPKYSGFTVIEVNSKKSLNTKDSDPAQDVKELHDKHLIQTYDAVHLLKSCNYKHIADILDVTKKKAAKYLSKLYIEGWIDRDSTDKPFRYFPKPGKAKPMTNFDIIEGVDTSINEHSNNSIIEESIELLESEIELLDAEKDLILKKIKFLRKKLQ